jgi:hypothetical protein
VLIAVRRTTPLQLVLAWSFAGIPLLAGVAHTLVNAFNRRSRSQPFSHSALTRQRKSSRRSSALPRPSR